MRMFVQKSVEAQRLRKESNKLAKIKNRQTALMIKENILKKEELVKRGRLEAMTSNSKSQPMLPLKVGNPHHMTASQLSFNGNSPKILRVKSRS